MLAAERRPGQTGSRRVARGALAAALSAAAIATATASVAGAAEPFPRSAFSGRADASGAVFAAAAFAGRANIAAPALPVPGPAARSGVPLAAFLPVAAEPADTTAELVTASGRHRFTVEIADTVAARSRGLMFRDSMAPDHGMLFDFGTDQDVAFWMKNTILSLDMVFIRGDGTVVSIAPATTPFSLEPVPSAAPARFVLEVIAGTAARIGLKPGDRLVSPRVRPR